MIKQTVKKSFEFFCFIFNKILNLFLYNLVDLRDFQLRIHGTKTKPVEYDRQIPAMRSVTVSRHKITLYRETIPRNSSQSSLAHCFSIISCFIYIISMLFYRS